MQAGGYEKYDVADEKAWIGEEIEGAVTQEFPSNEVVCLSNEPTCWQFGYSEDGNSFTFNFNRPALLLSFFTSGFIHAGLYV